MDLNRTSDLLLQQLKDGNPAAKEKPTPNRFYNTPFPEKELCIIWHTGDQASFYYSHLVWKHLLLNDGLNTLILYFIGSSLILKGYNLTILFTRFLYDEPHVIATVNPRYIGDIPSGEFVVTDAVIEK